MRHLALQDGLFLSAARGSATDCAAVGHRQLLAGPDLRVQLLRP